MTPSGRAPQRTTVVVELYGIAHGGAAVGRLPSGKVCFVTYAVPGERVRVEITDERRRWARARLLEVLDPSPDRVKPPCPYFGQEQPGGPPRCGGCQLQHIDVARQAELKRRVVVEQLERIGRLPDPPVAQTVRVADSGYRNRARFSLDQAGRLGFRRAGRDEPLPIDRCLICAPAVQRLRERAGDDWSGTVEVTVRAGLATGDAALVVRPGEAPLPPVPAAEVAVALVDGAGTSHALRGDPTITERVAGFDFRVSPTSFFQSSTAGAEVLVRLVRAAAAVGPGDTALDLYAGVGLFARALAADGAAVTAVEGDPGAAADARRNLAGTGARVVHAEAGAGLAGVEAADVVVCDPPRRGAGPGLCTAIAGRGPRAIVYVACDPASLARDARALSDRGYELVRAVPVDQFAQTAAIETVATFHPAPGSA